MHKKKKIVLLISAIIFVVVACVVAFLLLTKNSTISKLMDSEAPMITLNGDKTLVTVVGKKLELPKATATDNKDGDITDQISMIVGSGAKFCNIEDGALVASVGGSYDVIYFVEDKAGNEAYESITVEVAPVTPEAELEGVNDLSVLNTSGGVFYENFELGAKSPLLKNSFNNVFTLTGNEDAISGNSMIIDYNQLEGKTSKIQFVSMLPYVQSGTWEISFDIKLVSGTPIDNYYIAYSLNGDGSQDSYGHRVLLSDLQEGETKHFRYEKVIEIPEEEQGQYLFYLYRNGSAASDAVICLDNFVIKRTDLEYTTYIPTVEELEAGFTYDWSDSKIATFGKPVEVADIEDGEVRAELQANENFGDRVMLLTGDSMLHGIMSKNNPLFFEQNRRYVIEFNYYVVSRKDSYLTVFNGDANNRTVYGNLFSQTGVASQTTVRYLIGPAEEAFNIFLNGYDSEIYIGNVTFTLADRKDIERADYKELSVKELYAGHVFDFSKNNLPKLSSGNMSIEHYHVKDVDVDLPNGYFRSNMTTLVTGMYGLRLDYLEGLLKANRTINLSFRMYSETRIDSGHLHLLTLDENGKQVSDYRVAVTDLGNGMYDIFVQITCKGSEYKMSLYSTKQMFVYLESIGVSAMDAKSFAALDSGIKKTYNIDFDKEWLEFSISNTIGKYISEVPGVGGYGLYAKMAHGGAVFFTQLDDFSPDREYTITLTTHHTEKFGDLYALFFDENKKQINKDIAIKGIKEVEGDQVIYTFKFTTGTNQGMFGLYNTSTNVEEMYIQSVSIQCGEKINYKKLTEKELYKGHTYDFAKGNIPELTSYNLRIAYCNVNSSMGLPQGHFTNGSAVYIKGMYEVHMAFMDGLLKKGHTYNVSVKLYSEEELQGDKFHLLTFGKDGKQTSDYRMSVSNLGNGMYELFGQITLTSDVSTLKMYLQQKVSVYVDTITVSMMDSIPYVTLDSGITQDYSIDFDKSWMQFAIKNTVGKYVSDVPDVGGYGLHANMSHGGAVFFPQLNGFSADREYTITLVTHHTGKFGDLYALFFDENEKQVNSNLSIKGVKQVEGDQVTYTFRFTGYSGMGMFGLYNTSTNVEEMYIQSVDVQCGEKLVYKNLTEQELYAGHVFDYAADNVPKISSDYINIQHLDVENVNFDLPEGYFNQGMTASISGIYGLRLNYLDGLLATDRTIDLGFRFYSENAIDVNNIQLLTLNKNGKQVSAYNLALTDLGDGMYELFAQIICKESECKLVLYPTKHISIYMESMSVSAMDAKSLAVLDTGLKENYDIDFDQSWLSYSIIRAKGKYVSNVPVVGGYGLYANLGPTGYLSFPQLTGVTAGRTYTVKIKAYHTGNYGNLFGLFRGIDGIPFTKEVNGNEVEYTCSFTATEAMTTLPFGIYNASSSSTEEMYIQSLEISSYDLIAGYTVKPSDSAFVYEGSYNKAEMSQDGESLYVELTGSKPSFILHSFDGMLKAGNVYEFTVKMQDESNASSNLITMMARNGNWTVKAKKTVTAEGWIEYKTQICWPKNATSFVLYSQDGTFKGNIVSIGVVDKTAIKTATTNGGATVSANDGTLTYGGAPYTAVSVGGEEGAKTLNVKLSATSPSVYLHSFTDMLVAGTEYELKIVTTQATGTTPLILMMNNNLKQLNNLSYRLTKTTEDGKTVYTTTFMSPQGGCALLLYRNGADFEGNIESVILKGEGLTKGYTVKPSDSAFTYEGTYNKAEMSQDGKSLYVELTGTKPSFILHSFDGILTAGNVYEFTVKMQDESNASSNLITMMARNGNRTVKAKKTVTAEGWIEYKSQICWPENATSFVLYSQDGAFKGNIVSIGVVDKTDIKTAITNGGVTVSANDGTLTYGGAPYTAVSVGGEEGAKTLNVKLSSTSPSVFLHSFTDMLVAGTEYELKIVTTQATGTTPLVLMMNNNLTQLKDPANKGIAYTLTKTTEGDKTVYTAAFTAPAGGCALLLYRNGANFEANIESVILKAK